jgi:hypothetical protein
MTTIVVGGALANKAGSSGEAWVRMSWVRGLERLGLDVWFVEELAQSTRDDPAAEGWFRAVTDRFGLHGRATLLSQSHRESIAGPTLDDLIDVAADATLVNISGHLKLASLFGAFRQRVMVDIDPGFTQFWHQEGLAGANVEGHDLYFTIGELIGTPGCPIPTSGIEWRPVRQPVVLEDWPVSDPARPDRFTTVGTWRGPFGTIEHGGRTYGLKVHEFRKMFALPRRSTHEFEIALDIDPADGRDLAALRENGWRIVDPGEVARDPDAFRAYVQASGAEFSVAQGVYVDTRCGWFSDRTTRYLASGKPALLQDTGFGESLTVGEGVVPFRTIEQAANGAADIVARYPTHSAAARRIAEEHFDSDRVLARFCEQAGIG